MTWNLVQISKKLPLICDWKWHGISMRIHVTCFTGCANYLTFNYDAQKIEYWQVNIRGQHFYLVLLQLIGVVDKEGSMCRLCQFVDELDKFAFSFFSSSAISGTSVALSLCQLLWSQTNQKKDMQCNILVLWLFSFSGMIYAYRWCFSLFEECNIDLLGRRP